MISPEIQYLLNLADESHDVAKALTDSGHPRFSAAQSYYTIFYLAQALLLSKGLTFQVIQQLLPRTGRSLRRLACLIQSSIVTSSTPSNFARLDTMEMKGKK